MKAYCSKIETLSDASLKISLHVPKELLSMAFPLAYQEVDVTLAGQNSENREEVLVSLRNTAQRMVEILESELKGEDDG